MNRDIVNPVRGLTIEKEIEARIQNILGNFDFVRVHETMRLLNWRWASTAEDLECPTVGQLYQTAERLLHQVVDEKWQHCGTGGLEAHRYEHDDGLPPVLELKFVVTEWREE